jgi:hypothetical protein
VHALRRPGLRGDPPWVGQGPARLAPVRGPVATDQAGLPPVRDRQHHRQLRDTGRLPSGLAIGPMVPVHLFDILRQRRAMIPVPATYLVALVVAAALGVAAQLVLGWRWWLVAAGVVAAVWLVFFSTAFWGGGGSSRSLATEVLRVVSPRRAIERDHRQEVERFRAAPFPRTACRPPGRGRATSVAGGSAGTRGGGGRSPPRSVSPTASRWPRRARSCESRSRATARGSRSGPEGRSAGGAWPRSCGGRPRPPPTTSPSTGTRLRPPTAGPTRVGPG